MTEEIMLRFAQGIARIIPLTSIRLLNRQPEFHRILSIDRDERRERKEASAYNKSFYGTKYVVVFDTFGGSYRESNLLPLRNGLIVAVHILEAMRILQILQQSVLKQCGRYCRFSVDSR